MRFYFGIILSVLSSTAFANQVVIQAPCSAVPLVDTHVEFERATNVGDLTLKVLEQNHIPYIGNSRGINSIGGTATGEASIEIVGPAEWRVYGWCYLVNGIEPGVSPDQIQVTSNSDLITWFYAYASYKNGVWTEMCKPTNTTSPYFVCH
jgi:hypothetical protein